MPPPRRIYPEISTKLIRRMLVALLVIMMALRVSELAVYVVGCFVIYTLYQDRVEVSFFAFMLLVSLAIMNPFFFRKGYNFYMVTRGSILMLAIAMAIKTGLGNRAWFLTPFNWLYIYMGLIMVTSLAGWAPLISVMKGVLFLIFIVALIQGVSVIVKSGVDIARVRAGVLAMSLFFIVGSVLTIPFPSIGRSMILTRTEWWGTDADLYSGLFNGVTWHSQTLGPTVAILNAFLLSDYICNIRRRSWLYLVLMALIPVLVYMSSSRTGLVAYLLSILATVFFYLRERHISPSKKTRVVMFFLFASIVGMVAMSMMPGGAERMDRYLRKKQQFEDIDQTQGLGEAMASARLGFVSAGYENFLKRPWLGNGFQVSEQMRNYDYKQSGFVFTAPIEKGFLFTMVLEEAGLPGGILFLMFILSVYFKYGHLQFTCFLSTFTVFLGLNSGEAAFFSTSGGGGFLWMICFCALLMDIHRHRRRLQESRPPHQAPEPMLRQPAFP